MRSLAPSTSPLRRWMAWLVLVAMGLTAGTRAAHSVEMTLAAQGWAAEVCVAEGSAHGTAAGGGIASGLMTCADCICAAMSGAAWAVSSASPVLPQLAWTARTWFLPPAGPAVAIEPARGPPPRAPPRI